MAPRQSTIYDFGEVRHDRVERKYPDSTYDRVQVRLEQHLQTKDDVVDLTLDTYWARELARELLKVLGEPLPPDPDDDDDDAS